MRLWTIQTSEAYSILRRKGRLRGRWSLVWPEFKTAYRWLIEQMADRGIKLRGRPPIWAWVRKPDLRCAAHMERGRQGVRIELEVPDELVLCSDFEFWHSVLNNHHASINDDELDSWHTFSEQEVRKSWERIFDLRLFPKGVSQATFPSIEADYVVSVRHFTAR